MDETPAAPPSVSPPPDAGAPPQRSGWPTVVGSVSIAFAALGLLCYGCGSVNAILTPVFAQMQPPGGAPVAVPQGPLLVLQIVQTCALFGLAVWLLIGSIGLCMRRAWSRPHLVGWSVTKVILTLLGLLVGVLTAQQQAQLISDAFSQGGRQGFQVNPGLFIGLALIVSLFQLFWPVFLLVWLARPAVRSEVGSWAAAARAVI